jgi:hypothetical protein
MTLLVAVMSDDEFSIQPELLLLVLAEVDGGIEYHLSLLLQQRKARVEYSMGAASCCCCS